MRWIWRASAGRALHLSNAYAGNLRELAELLALYAEKTGKESCAVKSGSFRAALADDDTLVNAAGSKKAGTLNALYRCMHP